MSFGRKFPKINSNILGRHFKQEILDLGMTKAALEKSSSRFIKWINSDRKVKAKINEQLLISQSSAHPLFLQYLRDEFPEMINSKLASLLAYTDLSSPLLWYPQARRMKRKVIFHAGPTNSGKTFAALEKLAACKIGVYCGPLRLLAHEVYDKMNQRGIACNLRTGETIIEDKRISLYAATIEMANLGLEYNVAVVDEIQMISDPHRGWAWTQALLGLRASELHLCGEPSAINLVRNLISGTGDSFEIRHYERLTPLSVSKTHVRGLHSLQAGDAVVAFSRSDIFLLKSAIEKATRFKVATIYGNLPPETRAEQAKLFNDSENSLQILVASDAIGMGLNL